MSNATRNNTITLKQWDAFSAILFSLVYCDSLITYFGHRIINIRPAIIVLVVFLIFVIFRSVQKILPDGNTLFWFFLLVIGFISGIATAPDIGINRIPQLASASVAFLIGYYLFKYNSDESKLFNLLLILGFLNIVVCVIAILKIAPHYFPIEVSVWAHGYTLNERPAITTDQNFQFFYLFLPVLLVMLPANWLKVALAFLLLIGSVFVLERLQTRSGVLVIAGGTAMAVLYPFVSNRAEKKRIYIFLALLSPVILFFLPSIADELAPLITRFLSEGREQGTAEGRITSFLYIFDIVWNPKYWLPYGNPESLMGANKPHSNVAAVFLEAGMIGLIAWFMLFVVPIFKLAKQYLHGRGNRIASVAFVAGTMILILQLSLNVPVMDQVWLWAGATNGALASLRLRRPMAGGRRKSETGH